VTAAANSTSDTIPLKNETNIPMTPSGLVNFSLNKVYIR